MPVKVWGSSILHFPELGIASSERRLLDTPLKYKILFEKYRKDTLLSAKRASVNRLRDMSKESRSFALTCYERDSVKCHRRVLADVLEDDDVVQHL